MYQQRKVLLNTQDRKKIDDYRQTHGKSLIVTATSQSIVQQLEEAMPTFNKDDDYIICFSQRIAHYAQERGWKNCHFAEYADNLSLIDRIIEVQQSLKQKNSG